MQCWWSSCSLSKRRERAPSVRVGLGTEASKLVETDVLGWGQDELQRGVRVKQPEAVPGARVEVVGAPPPRMAWTARRPRMLTVARHRAA